MELLHGEDLGSRIKRTAPMPLAVTADIIAQVARALRVAHAAAIVHAVRRGADRA
jgi:serine/threonine protein kinase